MPQNQQHEHPRELTAVIQRTDEPARSNRDVALTAVKQLADLNGVTITAWTSGLEQTWQAALELQRARLEAMRSILQTTVQANQSLARQWLEATQQTQRAVLDGQIAVLQAATHQNHAVMQLWAELVRDAAAVPQRAINAAVQEVQDAAAERLLESPADQVELHIRELEDPSRLEALERVERAGRQRKTVLEAIQTRRERLNSAAA
jgi:hypothetical protein